MLVACCSVWETAVLPVSWGRVPQQTQPAPGCSCHSKCLGGSCHVAAIEFGSNVTAVAWKTQCILLPFSDDVIQGMEAQGTAVWEVQLRGQDVESGQGSPSVAQGSRVSPYHPPLLRGWSLSLSAAICSCKFFLRSYSRTCKREPPSTVMGLVADLTDDLFYCSGPTFWFIFSSLQKSPWNIPTIILRMQCLMSLRSWNIQSPFLIAL